jgi:hypothetical protein
MVNEVFTATDFQLTETKLLRDVANAISDAEARLHELSEDVDQVEVREAVEKAAHIEAINFITDRAEQLLHDAFMLALFQSVEYNHSMFIGQSEVALSTHWQQVLSIVPQSPGKVVVNIDFSPLGDIESYAAAVDQARETLGMQMRNRPESRSIFWRRRIYGVDREGRTVMTKPRADSKNPPQDITDRYIGRWEQTVRVRLSYLESDQAPWWYIVNFGNENAFPQDTGGNPYPVVHGTHFIEVLETQILEIFNRIYRESLDEWEEWYADLIADDYGLDQFDDFDALASTLEPNIAKQIEQEEELKPTNRTIGSVEQNGKVYDLYVSSKGKISRRYSLSKN